MSISLYGGHINRKQVEQHPIPPFDIIRNTIIEANKDIYDDMTDTFYLKPKLNIRTKLQIFTIMKTDNDKLKTERKEELTRLESNVMTSDEEKYIKANELYFLDVSISKRQGKGVEADRAKLEKFKTELPEWESLFNIIKSNDIFDAENNFIFFSSIKSNTDFMTILKYYMTLNGKIEDWDRYIKLYKNIHLGNSENIDEYIKDYEKVKQKDITKITDEVIIAEITKNEEKLRLKFTNLESKLQNWKEIYETNKVLINSVKDRKKINSRIENIKKEEKEIDNKIDKINNYIEHTELFNSKIITEYIDGITIPIDINDIIVLQKIRDNIIKKDNDSNSIKCIDNIIKLDSINADNIHKDLKSYYNTISERLIDSDIISRYKKVISNIVPFILNKTTFFSFLAGTDNRKYIIYKKLGDNFYEIYKSFDGIVPESDYDKYILNSNYTFTVAHIDSRSIIKKLTKYKYPNFSNKIKNIENFIESQVLMSNPSNLNKILIFYNNFIGDNFKQWSKTFCVIDPRDRVIVYFNKINTMKVCILASKINYYFNMYDIIDQINKDGDEKARLMTKIKIIQTKNIWDKTVTPETVDNITLIQQEINTEKKSNDNQDISIIKLFIIITKYIKNNKTHNLLILNELTGYENKDIIISIIKCIISYKLPDNEMDEIGYSYNFYSINSLYDEIEGNINNISTIASIRQLNSIIKCDIEQLKSLFILNFIKELYYYYLSNQNNLINISTFNFYKTFTRYMFFRDLNDDPFLSKITNTSNQFYLEHFDDQPTPIALSETHFTKVQTSSFNLKFFYYNLFSGNGITDNFIKIVYDGKHSIFKDPRNEYLSNLNINSSSGRPFCGEICLLNFINLLLYNVTTQSLDAAYFPNSVNTKLKSFYEKNKKIINFNNKSIYTEFYTFLKDIPFELKQEIEINAPPQRSSFDRDYGDWYTNGIYRYFITTPEQTFSQQYKTYKNSNGEFMNSKYELPTYDVGTTYKISKGNELRLSYFNLCRVLSYLLKLEGELHLDNIQTNLTDETLKKIISKFKNPNIDKYVNSYKYSGFSSNIYNTNSKNINILDYKFSLAGHSDIEKTTGGKNIEIYKILQNAPFYDYTIWGHYLRLKKEFLGRKSTPPKLSKLKKLELTQLQKISSQFIYDIPFAFYAATMKNNNIFSEINFGIIEDDNITKYFNIVQSDEIFDSFFYNKKIIIELIKTQKDKSLDTIFLSKKSVNDDLWTEFIKYRIDKVDFNTIFRYINDFYIVNNGKLKISKEITRCILYGKNHINLDQFKLLESKIIINYIELVKLYEKNREVYDYLFTGRKLDSYIKTDPEIFKGYFYVLLDDSTMGVNNNSIIEYFNNPRAPNSIGGYDFSNKRKLLFNDYLDVYTDNIKFSNNLLKVLQKININIPYYEFRPTTFEIFNKKIFLNYDLVNYKEFKENKELFKTYGILLNKSLELDSERIIKKLDSFLMLYENINARSMHKLKYFKDDIVNNIIESNLKMLNIILLAIQKYKTKSYIIDFIDIISGHINQILDAYIIPSHLSFYFKNSARSNDQFNNLIKTLNNPEINKLIEKFKKKVMLPRSPAELLKDEIDSKYKKYKNKYLAIKKNMELRL